MNDIAIRLLLSCAAVYNYRTHLTHPKTMLSGIDYKLKVGGHMKDMQLEEQKVQEQHVR